MSKHDAAKKGLKYLLREIRGCDDTAQARRAMTQLKAGLVALEQAERYEALHEAAGKVDKPMCLSALKGWRISPDDEVAMRAAEQIDSLLSAIPGGGK